ncbi:DUF6894 family protein [Devosia neptuniae]|uniref:DUF6894 family protein n=1 Tax=Devosia neptuniae TaxID=191302 RepID=UPI0022B00B5E|nr:hypothetical protein [Devosia neptuniae]MCZ4345504.1 hypothetical protein [Devosia neptuniae]
MPRFFFNHASLPSGRNQDIDGLKLPSLNNALEEAAFAARESIKIAKVSNDYVEGVFEIEDEGRVLVGRVPYRHIP